MEKSANFFKNNGKPGNSQGTFFKNNRKLRISQGISLKITESQSKVIFSLKIMENQGKVTEFL